MQKESKLKNLLADARDISIICSLGCLIYANFGFQKLKKRFFDISNIDYVEERDELGLNYNIKRIPKYKK